MTPTAAVVASAAATRRVIDAGGRSIELRGMTALDKLRLFKAAGAALSQNEMWLGMALLACSVTAIDDIPVPQPMSEAQIESLIARLGDVGLVAVGEALEQTVTEEPIAEDPVALGNCPGTLT